MSCHMSCQTSCRMSYVICHGRPQRWCAQRFIIMLARLWVHHSHAIIFIQLASIRPLHGYSRPPPLSATPRPLLSLVAQQCPHLARGAQHVSEAAAAGVDVDLLRPRPARTCRGGGAPERARDGGREWEGIHVSIASWSRIELVVDRMPQVGCGLPPPPHPFYDTPIPSQSALSFAAPSMGIYAWTAMVLVTFRAA